MNASNVTFAKAAKYTLQLILICEIYRFSQMMSEGSDASITSCSSPSSFSPLPDGLKTGFPNRFLVQPIWLMHLSNPSWLLKVTNAETGSTNLSWSFSISFLICSSIFSISAVFSLVIVTPLYLNFLINSAFLNAKKTVAISILSF